MSTRLVYATSWGSIDDVWRCKLLLDGDPGEVLLEARKPISIKVEEGRFCVGHSHITRDYTGSDSWKERVACPTSSSIESGRQCQACGVNDASTPCARCTGETCTAHPNVRNACEHSEAYVYLAIFGERVKAGVSQGRRVEKRWVEQGADAARRVLHGNGREVRIFEKRIQDELGALRLLKAEEKMRFTDAKELEKGLKNLEEYGETINRLFPSANRIREETRLLTLLYGLPATKTRPIEIKIRDRIEISGTIMGVKGPVLFLERTGAIYTINLHSLVGRKISENASGSTLSQSGLGIYMRKRLNPE